MYGLEDIRRALKAKKWLKWLGGATAFIVLVFVAVPLPTPLFPDDYSQLILDRNGEMLRVFLNDREQIHFPPKKDRAIPKKLETAILAYEDRYFYYHIGVNPISILKAAYQNAIAGRIVGGGSTVTMQVIRLSGNRSRTYWNKVIEIFQAIKLDAMYSKKDILRAYINHAPYGSNLVGLESAAFAYFDKDSTELSWAEAALFAVLPNAPGIITPIHERARLKRKRDVLLRYLAEQGHLKSLELKAALDEPIPSQIRALPFWTPHLARYLSQKYEDQNRINTTIDPEIQADVVALVKNHYQFLKAEGIKNTAVVVAEASTGEVRAYVGSHDFFDNQHQGQIDAVRVPRSSASILKPFLYGAAIDEGLLHSSTLIKDIPTYFNDFEPRNPRKTFDGFVTTKQALIRSLNVPAVRVLNAYGLEAYYDLLKSAGVTTLFREAHDYGLPLILGGGETSLWDVTGLYRSFAIGGQVSPLTVIADTKMASSTLMSPGAAWMITDILKKVRRPGAEYYWELYGDKWPFAWKTGTSYGQKDAWAVGVGPEWVIGVWVGDLTGDGNKNLGGARFAGPLLFDVLNDLPKKVSKRWFTRNYRHFREVKLCRNTGFIYGLHCDQYNFGYVPIKAKSLAVCRYHETITVNKEGDQRVCYRCWDQHGYRYQSQLIYPADVAQYMHAKGMAYPSMPPHKPECKYHVSSGKMSIKYPTHHARLLIPKDIGGVNQRTTFSVAHQTPNSTVHWYLDGEYLGETQNVHKRAVHMEEGAHILRVIDEYGIKKEVRFYSYR